MKYELGIRNNGLGKWLISVVVTALVFYSLFMIHNSSAQTAPKFMVTWKANSFVPAEYQGKVFPSVGTSIQVSFELADKKQLADLSRIEVRWYLNGQFQKSGLGLKIFSFTADRFNSEQQVKISLVNYKGADLDEFITIPIANPEVVIDAPYADGQIEAATNDFKSLLYFFNISSLWQARLSWSANGNDATGAPGSPNVLILNTENLPSLANVSLQVRAQSAINPLEVAAKLINLVIK